MEQTDLTYFSAENQKEYLALAAEYLPDSEKEKMERRAGRYPRAFVALAIEAELAGVWMAQRVGCTGRFLLYFGRNCGERTVSEERIRKTSASGL